MQLWVSRRPYLDKLLECCHRTDGFAVAQKVTRVVELDGLDSRSCRIGQIKPGSAKITKSNSHSALLLVGEEISQNCIWK